ncbi:MAG: FeoA family protein [Verrucomicrobiota bacterium]|nr:FeoA family protein [Verrucomicrobiota bacterium]
MKLKDFEVGSSIKITGYAKSGKAYRQKLLAMGLRKGLVLKITRKAPLGDPIELNTGSFNLSLRKDEANALKVEEVKK